MTYSLFENKIIVGLEYGDTRISFKLEPDDYCQSTVNLLAESMAQDARIPVAEEL